MSSSTSPVRRPWLAVLLAMFGGPIGHMYCGRLGRGLLLWVLWIPLTILSLTTIHFTDGRVGVAFWLLCFLGYSLFFTIDAYRSAKLQQNHLRRWYQRWWAYLLVYILCALTINLVAEGMRTYAMEAFVVPARSMSPTILPGDRLLTDKFWCRPSMLKRNDVVVFRSAGPDSPLYVMRVVGLAGDVLEIRDEKIWLNGEAWPDSHGYLNPDDEAVPELSDYGPVTIPAETFFVLGDNRRRSKDSRILGPIPFSDFHGRATMIYFSMERRFPNPYDTSKYENGSILWSRIGQRL